jgi:hypothetical protein
MARSLVSIATPAIFSSITDRPLAHLCGEKMELELAHCKSQVVWDALELELEAAWEDMFQNLLLYQYGHGDTLVPQSYAKFQQLGSWVNSQRKEYRRKQKWERVLAHRRAHGEIE